MRRENAIQDILDTPDCLDIPGARSVQLSDSASLQHAMAHKPEVAVMDWNTTLLPTEEILPAARVKDLVLSLVEDVELFSENQETKNLSLDEFRAWIMEREDAYKELFKKLPRLFRLVVNGEKSGTKLMKVMELIEIRRHQESQNMTTEEKRAQVSDFFRTTFVRPAEPGEEEAAVREGRGFRGTMVSSSEIKQDLL